jgi:hypothetical protein
MKKFLILNSLLAAGLLAAGGAQAQIYDNSAAATSDTPVRAGEASTMTGGVPNMRTTNSPYPDGTAVVSVAAPGYVVTSPSYPYVISSPSYPYTVTTPSTPAVVAGTTVYTYPGTTYSYSTAPHYPYGPSGHSTAVMGAAPVYVYPGSAVVLNRPLLGDQAVVRPREIVPGPTYVLPR